LIPSSREKEREGWGLIPSSRERERGLGFDPIVKRERERVGV
jgi:hypothetical protein